MIIYWNSYWRQKFFRRNCFCFSAKLSEKSSFVVVFAPILRIRIFCLFDSWPLSVSTMKKSDMKKSSGFFRGMFDGLRSTVSQPSTGLKSDLEFDETLKANHFQVAKVSTNCPLIDFTPIYDLILSYYRKSDSFGPKN